MSERERQRDLEESRLQRQVRLKFLFISLTKPTHNLYWYWAKDVVLIKMVKNSGVLYLPMFRGYNHH
jgi:hypothetical protein